jgi:hypothetical protein
MNAFVITVSETELEPEEAIDVELLIDNAVTSNVLTAVRTSQRSRRYSAQSDFFWNTRVDDLFPLS